MGSEKCQLLLAFSTIYDDLGWFGQKKSKNVPFTYSRGFQLPYRGNAQCVQGCVKDRSSGLEGLFNFHVQEAEEL